MVLQGGIWCSGIRGSDIRNDTGHSGWPSPQIARLAISRMDVFCRGNFFCDDESHPCNRFLSCLYPTRSGEKNIGVGSITSAISASRNLLDSLFHKAA